MLTFDKRSRKRGRERSRRDTPRQCRKYRQVAHALERDAGAWRRPLILVSRRGGRDAAAADPRASWSGVVWPVSGRTRHPTELARVALRKGSFGAITVGDGEAWFIGRVDSPVLAGEAPLILRGLVRLHEHRHKRVPEVVDRP